MSKPLAIDFFCGLGGWTEGLLLEGFDVIGFDIERHEYDDLRYPGQLVLQDVRTLDGARFADAALIVGSSPCQEFSYRAMPWRRARELPPPFLGIELFEAQFRIQREACKAARRHIPMVVENVRGAQRWVGRSRWNYGSYHLWGDVPALMPMAQSVRKAQGFRFDGSGRSFQSACAHEAGIKVAGLNWSRYREPGYKGEGFNTHAARQVDGRKNAGGSWFRVAHDTTSGKGRNPDGRPLPPHTPHMTNPAEHDGCGWFGKNNPSAMRQHSSKSNARKRATALISKIPLELARHIGRVYYPREQAA